MLCGFTVLLVTFGMFAMGWIGGGDAKLVSATAIWMGWALLLPYLLIASVFGGVLTMLLLMFADSSCRLSRESRVGSAPAQAKRWHSLWGGIGGIGHLLLSKHANLAFGGWWIIWVSDKLTFRSKSRLPTGSFIAGLRFLARCA